MRTIRTTGTPIGGSRTCFGSIVVAMLLVLVSCGSSSGNTDPGDITTVPIINAPTIASRAPTNIESVLLYHDLFQLGLDYIDEDVKLRSAFNNDSIDGDAWLLVADEVLPHMHRIVSEARSQH